MEKIFSPFPYLLIFFLFSLIQSQKSCNDIINSNFYEDNLITDLQSNFQNINKESDK